MAGHAGAIGELAQAVRVGAAPGADDQQQVALLEEFLDCVLPVLGGVADVFLARRGERRKPAPQRLDDLARVVDGQCGLRHERKSRRVAHL